MWHAGREKLLGGTKAVTVNGLENCVTLQPIGMDC